MRQPRDDDGKLPADPMDRATDVLVGAQQSVATDDEDDDVSGRLQIFGIGKSTFATVTLPGPGTFLIGRSRECTLRIDDASISRRHAALHVGDELEIEDLESRNGTHVAGNTLKPHERAKFTLGEIVTVGKISIIVQQRSSPLRPRRVWTHDEFEARLGEECARAERSGVPLALLRVQTPGAREQHVLEILSELLRQSDVIGIDGPEIHEVLLPDTPREQAIEVHERLESKLRERGITCSITRASFPQEARSSHALISRVTHQTKGGSRHEIVVRDPVMQNLHALAKRIAGSNIGVLILGETGVGKDVLAERIHAASARSGKPFLQINCAGFTETILESELFGHEKGSFTGAVAAKEGLLETAHGGTVFLDEIGDTPPATQAKLLRILEDGMMRRVGGLKARPIDVRFIAATNRDLEAEVVRGSFRRDLYFRLNGVTILVPPLRDRVVEIEPLVHLFAARAAADAGITVPKIEAQALDMLRSYSWPGNVRELRNVISRAVILAVDGKLGLSALPLEKMRTTLVSRAPTQRRTRSPSDPVSNTPAPMLVPRRPRRGEEEAEWIRRGLEMAGGNQTRAAKLLGISRRTLINRLADYGFERPRKDPDDDAS